MKKVLIGVGIGCGTLLLLIVVGGVGAGYWAKKNFGGVVENTEKMQVQKQQMASLDSRFPFTPPPEGTPLALQEPRLQTYFAVREASMAAFQEFETKARELEAQNQAGVQRNMSDVIAAGSLLTGLMANVREDYIAALEKNSMSPREFQAITHTLYATYIGDAMVQAKKAQSAASQALEKQLDEVATKLEDETLTEQQRTELEAQQTALEEQLTALEEAEAAEAEKADPAKAAEAEARLAANKALLDKYKERIEKLSNLTFDSMVVDETFNGTAGASQP
jgi:hypothetical protein